MINPWHKNEVDMIRTNTALHLDLSPQVGRNAERLVRSLPDEGPVVMVNLVRFRERSLDGNCSGWDAYSRYSKGGADYAVGDGNR
jgi:hypothetical protein